MQVWKVTQVSTFNYYLQVWVCKLRKFENFSISPSIIHPSLLLSFVIKPRLSQNGICKFGNFRKFQLSPTTYKFGFVSCASLEILLSLYLSFIHCSLHSFFIKPGLSQSSICKFGNFRKFQLSPTTYKFGFVSCASLKIILSLYLSFLYCFLLSFFINWSSQVCFKVAFGNLCKFENHYITCSIISLWFPSCIYTSCRPEDYMWHIHLTFTLNIWMTLSNNSISHNITKYIFSLLLPWFIFKTIILIGVAFFKFGNFLLLTTTFKFTGVTCASLTIYSIIWSIISPL